MYIRLYKYIKLFNKKEKNMKPYRNFSGTLGLIIVCIFVFIMYFGKKNCKWKVKNSQKQLCKNEEKYQL